jgi:hypothetical protein
MLILSTQVLAECPQGFTGAPPNQFIDGETAYAEQVNENFDCVYSEVGRIGQTLNINDEGSVGIGTSTPQADLDVNGTIRAKKMRIGYVRVLNQDGCVNQQLCTISCPDGKYVISGGCRAAGNSDQVVGSYPDSDHSWFCQGNPTHGLYQGWAICMDIVGE